MSIIGWPRGFFGDQVKSVLWSASTHMQGESTVRATVRWESFERKEVKGFILQKI